MAATLDDHYRCDGHPRPISQVGLRVEPSRLIQTIRMQISGWAFAADPALQLCRFRTRLRTSGHSDDEWEVPSDRPHSRY